MVIIINVLEQCVHRSWHLSSCVQSVSDVLISRLDFNANGVDDDDYRNYAVQMI